MSWLSPYLYKEAVEIHHTLHLGVDSTKHDLSKTKSEHLIAQLR